MWIRSRYNRKLQICIFPLQDWSFMLSVVDVLTNWLLWDLLDDLLSLQMKKTFNHWTQTSDCVLHSSDCLWCSSLRFLLGSRWAAFRRAGRTRCVLCSRSLHLFPPRSLSGRSDLLTPVLLTSWLRQSPGETLGLPDADFSPISKVPFVRRVGWWERHRHTLTHAHTHKHVYTQPSSVHSIRQGDPAESLHGNLGSHRQSRRPVNFQPKTVSLKRFFSI